MSEQESNSENGEKQAVSTPPEQQQTPPQQQSQTPPQQPAQQVDLSGLMTALNALPETIAKSVREAVGTPKAPESKSEATKSESSKESTAEKPGEVKKENARPGAETGTMGERFARWWTK